VLSTARLKMSSISGLQSDQENGWNIPWLISP
jgi:hypothetical protein